MNEKETLPVAERDRERLEREHQKDLERIRGFRLIDDDFMNVCFDDNIPVTELLLRIILGRQVFVKQVRTQRNFKNLVGRDLYLDVLAVEDDGTQMNVEIQRSDSGADPKRARYHSSILDSHSLKPSEDFTMLPETYVIFITENDVLGDDQQIYRIERIIRDSGKPFGDGEHIVYVNCEIRDDGTELGKLIHDFFCEDPGDMNYSVLADRVRYFKEDTKGVRTMCKVIEEMRKEVWNEAWNEAWDEAWGKASSEAELKTKEASVRRMYLKGFPADQIAYIIDLPVDEVKNIISSEI